MVSEIEKAFPRLSQRTHRAALIQRPTEVHALEGLGRAWNHAALLVKREDQTDDEYGGNKVRNLEFVLGDAQNREAKRLLTLVPYGSNFTAALCLHARRLGFEVQLTQFVAQRNSQIEKHVQFCLRHEARMTNYEGFTGPARAVLKAGLQRGLGRGEDAFYWITPGASNVLGALGHANAFFEFQRQRRQMGMAEPDYLVVGAGTCGTIAGLTAGVMLSGSRTRVIGVRCAEKLVCNERRVRGLAGEVFRLASDRKPSRQMPFRIVDAPGSAGYAIPCDASYEVMRAFSDYENISLDTTYTAKVGLFLKHALTHGEFRGASVLYWHTYSPRACNWTSHAIRQELQTKRQGVSCAVA